MFEYLCILLNARLAKMDQRGATAVEYGLVIAGVALALVVVAPKFFHVLQNTFKSSCGKNAGANGTC